MLTQARKYTQRKFSEAALKSGEGILEPINDDIIGEGNLEESAVDEPSGTKLALSSPFHFIYAMSTLPCNNRWCKFIR